MFRARVLTTTKTLAAAIVLSVFGVLAAEAAECPNSFKDYVVEKIEKVPAHGNPTTGKPDSAPTDSQDPIVGLGDTIVLTISNLDRLLQSVSGCPGKLVLTMNGLPISDLGPQLPIDPALGKITFKLKLGEENSRRDWVELLGRPTLDGRPVVVSIAPISTIAIPSKARAKLVSFRKGILIGWLGFLIVLMIAFVLLARNSGILRNTSVELAPGLNGRPQYSLSRVQAAWWFFWVLTSFILIGAVTGDYENALNTTALGLLAIGSATLAGSMTIDSSQSTDSEQSTQNADKLLVLTKQIRRNELLQGAALSTEEKQAMRKQIASDRTAANRLAGISKGFLIDIVSDSSGVVFHRFQIVVWSFVLTVIFVVDVYRDLSMPEFSATLLGLQTLSATTYLGLKIPEAKTVQTKKT